MAQDAVSVRESPRHWSSQPPVLNSGVLHPPRADTQTQRKKARGCGLSLAKRKTNELGALYLASLHAAGAYIGLAHTALRVLDGDLLDIRAEHSVRYAVRVADVAPRNRMLTANFANFRHRYHSRFVLLLHGTKTVDDKKALTL